MANPQGDNPVEEWFKQALLLTLGDSSHYFNAAQRADENGHPEEALEPLYELHDRLCDLLGNAPNAQIVDTIAPTLLRTLVRCDLAIASQFLMMCQQNPRDKEFVNEALGAAQEQYVFVRDLPDYDVLADEQLPDGLRMLFVKLAEMFD